MFMLWFGLLIYGSSLISAESASQDQELIIEVVSERTDLSYNASIHNNSKNFAYRKTNITMCVQIVDVIESLANVQKCNAQLFENANPGIRATIYVVIELNDEEQPFEVFNNVRKAIVTEAINDDHWLVKDTDIIIKQVTVAASATVNNIQVPLLIGLLVFLQYFE